MSNKTATISVRIEPELKEQAEKILNDLNVSVSELISVLYKQIVIKQGIPFPIDLLEDENQVNQMVKCKNCMFFSPKNSLGTQGFCQCEEKEYNYGGEFYPYQNDSCSYGKMKG